jgi:hypothetical protein
LRDFYHVERAAEPERKPSGLARRIVRWGMVLYACGCVLLNARLVRNAAMSPDLIEMITRVVLFELEVLLAMVVLILTFRIIPYRTSR